jgi:hypothetical protein
MATQVAKDEKIREFSVAVGSRCLQRSLFFKKPIHQHFNYTALVALELIIVSDFWNLGVEVFPSGTLKRSGETEAPMQLVSRCLSRFAS